MGVIASSTASYISHEKMSRDIRLDNHLDEKVIFVGIYSCRILHGSYSWLATIGKNALTLGASPTLEHHWMILETKKHYWLAHIYPGEIEIIPYTNLNKAHRRGMSATGNSNRTKWCEKKHTYHTPKVKLRRIKNLAMRFNTTYDIVHNNCQDFCEMLWSRMDEHD